MVKHETPDWMDELLDRYEIEDLEDLYEILRQEREEFWEEFWRPQTDVKREIELEMKIEEAKIRELFVKERGLEKFERVIEKVDPKNERVHVWVRRADGNVQRYWMKVEKVREYRVAPKSRYLWRPRRK
jgi:hypothetical protein